MKCLRELPVQVVHAVEWKWLTGRMAPDFKTIARFRKDNSKAIRSVCRQFVMQCQPLDLVSEALMR
jgi:transposase